MTKTYIKTGLVIFFFQIFFFTVSGCGADEDKQVRSDASDEAWIGVYVQNLDPELSRYFELDDNEGVIVNRIVDDSPADEAGLREEDVILKFDRKRIKNSTDLAEIVRKMSPGDEVRVELLRKQDKKTVRITIGSRPERESWRSERYGARPPVPPRPPAALSASRSWLGIEMTEMDDDLADYFKVDDDDGVLILSVVEDSPADDAGLKSGDVLMEIGDKRIRSRQDVVEAIAEYEPGDEVEIRIKRKGRNKDIDVELGSQKWHNHHGFNREDWREFRREMHDWQKEFRQEMSRIQPELERELRVLKDIELPFEEIEEQLKSEMSGMHDHIRKELRRVELELQMEFGESL